MGEHLSVLRLKVLSREAAAIVVDSEESQHLRNCSL